MIELKNLEKTYRTSKGSVTAIKDINITINDGEIFGSRQKHTRPLYKLP